MEKRSFILLEILIAIAVIGLCIVPLVVQSFSVYRTQALLLQQVERERLADWTFSEIKEKLLKNEIPWKNLPDLNKRGRFSLPDIDLVLSKTHKKKLQREFTLLCEKEKKGPQEEIYRFYTVKISFFPVLSEKKKELFEYGVMVRKLET